MKINKLKYKDNVRKWELEELEFFDLTLLVGISGVGKTQILSAILNLKDIANGKSLNGVEWGLAFSIGDNIYRWSGEFETVEQMSEFRVDAKKVNSKLEFSRFFDRKPAIFIFDNNKVQFLSNTNNKHINYSDNIRSIKLVA